MKNIFLFALGLLLFPLVGTAQETWSLEKCIRHAQEKSLLVQQSQLAVENSEITLQQNKMSRFPTVNASSSLSANSGRTFDIVSNDPVTQTSFFNSLGINSNVVLYQGGRIKNSIRQSQLDIKASELDKEQTTRDIALQVAQAYLQILLSEEQLQSVKAQLKQTQDQLVQTNKLIRAGTLPANSRLDIEAQIARNEQTVIAAENAVALGYLSLKQLMFLDMNKDIKVFAPGIEVDESIISGVNLQSIYSQAISTQPNIRAGNIRLKSADMAEEVAKAGKKPTIAAFAGVSTNYSSLAQTVDGFTTQTISQPFSIEIAGQTQTGNLDFENDVPVFAKQSYPNQIWENIGQNIGVSINYPIWDNKMTKLQVERAQLNRKNVEVQNEQLKQRLMIDIQNAYTNAKAAQKSYQAADRSLVAQKASYENTKKRFDLGSANAFELSTARNTLSLAETELIRSKYDYIFRLKILDFYSGKPIKL